MSTETNTLQTDATQTPPPLLTAAQLAQALGLCSASVRRAAKAGCIPFIKTGGRIRFTPEQVSYVMREGFSVPKSKKKREVKTNGA